MTEARLDAANDLNTGLRELREACERVRAHEDWLRGGAKGRSPYVDYAGAPRSDLVYHADLSRISRAGDPESLLALTEVAEQLVAHVKRTHDGFGDPPCNCTPCRDARAALARLSVCLGGAHSPEGAA